MIITFLKHLRLMVQFSRRTNFFFLILKIERLIGLTRSLVTLQRKTFTVYVKNQIFEISSFKKKH